MAKHGDSLGAANIAYTTPHAERVGPWVDIGERVRFICTQPGYYVANQEATITARRGLGRVQVRLDDGRNLNVPLSRLWLPKNHKETRDGEV